MSDRAVYTMFKVRKELGDIADQLIDDLKPVLSLYGMDNRSGFVTFLLINLARSKGINVDIGDLRGVYPDLFSE